MARLAISEKFEADHGSFDVRRDTYTVIVYVDGPVINGFVLGLNSVQLRERVSVVAAKLEGKYLDDIVGRATNEHIGLYILHQLNEDPVSVVRIKGDQHDVEVYPADIDHQSYPAQLLYECARSFLYRDKVDDAIHAVGGAIELDASFALAYNLRGRCNRTKERWDLALPDFERAVELDPNFGEAYRNIGNALYHLDRTEEMIPAFSKTVNFMPNSALAVNNRGFAYQRLGEWDLALADHTRAIELDPNYAESHSDRAIALKAVDRIAEAIEHERIAEDLTRTGRDTYAKKIFY